MIKHEQISYTFEGGDVLYFESNGMIRQVKITKDHLSSELLMDRYLISSMRSYLQTETGELLLLNVDEKLFERSNLFADLELLEKKLQLKQLKEYDFQFKEFVIRDFDSAIIAKFPIENKKELLAFIDNSGVSLLSIRLFVVTEDGVEISYHDYVSQRRDASHIKYDNLLENFEFKN